MTQNQYPNFDLQAHMYNLKTLSEMMDSLMTCGPKSPEAADLDIYISTLVTVGAKMRDGIDNLYTIANDIEFDQENCFQAA